VEFPEEELAQLGKNTSPTPEMSYWVPSSAPPKPSNRLWNPTASETALKSRTANDSTGPKIGNCFAPATIPSASNSVRAVLSGRQKWKVLDAERWKVLDAD
jgi:hypothetical protein